MPYSVRCTRSCTAAPETVYDLLADPAHWPLWLPGTRSAAWEEPDKVRRIIVSGLTMREQVLVADRPRHHAYTIVSGIPVRNHRADVRITPDRDGCVLTWEATFSARIPGTGPLLWLMLRASVQTMVKALARGAETHQA